MTHVATMCCFSAKNPMVTKHIYLTNQQIFISNNIKQDIVFDKYNNIIYNISLVYL